MNKKVQDLGENLSFLIFFLYDRGDVTEVFWNYFAILSNIFSLISRNLYKSVLTYAFLIWGLNKYK